MSAGARITRNLAVIAAVMTVASVSACTATGDPSDSGQDAAPHREPHTVAFIGDSYTEPMDGSTAYWQTTATEMCWQAVHFGKPGSGYTISGYDGSGQYGSQLDAVAATLPDIVIIQGSFNDLNPDSVEDAAGTLFASVHQRLPSAHVFAMGPVNPGLRPDVLTRVEQLSNAVRDAAEQNWTVFIDAQGFLPEPSLLLEDMVHPSMRGHQVLGEKLADAIPDELSSCE